MTSGRFHAKLLGSPYGVWAAIEGGLLSLNIFLYSYLRPGRSAAELGFSALTVDLMERFGSPSDAVEAQHDIYWALRRILLEVHHDLAGVIHQPQVPGAPLKGPTMRLVIQPP
ncbi:hypothetical protein IWX62_000135 [Arthrobacter sp. CAN_A1]